MPGDLTARQSRNTLSIDMPAATSTGNLNLATVLEESSEAPLETLEESQRQLLGYKKKCHKHYKCVWKKKCHKVKKHKLVCGHHGRRLMSKYKKVCLQCSLLTGFVQGFG